ncbi:MAG: thiamine ABC transporter substrate-binding protein [Nitriliruptoraceae bacterium]
MNTTAPLSRRLALCLALALVTAACGNGDAPSETTDTPADAGSDDLVTIRLVTHDSFNASEDVLAAFTQDTGIGVEVVPLGDAGSLVNQAILRAGDPPGDVLYGIDNTFLSRATDAELFTAYEAEGLDHVDPKFVPDAKHAVTPIDFGDVCINYDREWFADNDLAVPENLDALTEPDYAGLLAVQNPATSSPGLAFLLASVEHFGEDAYLDFWQDLRDNDVLVTNDWSQAYYEEFTLVGGERPLVVSYASSPPAEVYFADPQPDVAPTGVMDRSCFRQIEYAGILAGTEYETEAQQLIDFLLTPTFQEDVPLNMFVFPVTTDAALPDVFAEHAVIPDDPFELDPDTIGAQRDTWIEAWTATVLR